MNAKLEIIKLDTTDVLTKTSACEDPDDYAME